MTNNQKLVPIKSVFIFIGLLFTTYIAFADVAQDCKQEALDYGYESDLLDDYVKGCVESRGGEIIVEDTPTSEAEASEAELSEAEPEVIEEISELPETEPEEIVEISEPEDKSAPVILSPFSR